MSRWSCSLLVLVTVFLLWEGTVEGQSFRTLTREDGLSSREYHGVCQDHEGFIWLCGLNGVDRYDGNVVRHYALPISDKYLIGVHYPMILCAPDGGIWVYNEGVVFRHDRNSDTLVEDADLSFSGPQMSVRRMFFDQSGEKLFCTSDGIVQGYDLGTCVALSGTDVFTLTQWDDDTYFAGCGGGYIVRLERKGSGKPYGFSSIGTGIQVEGTVTSMAVVHDELLVGSFSGLYVYALEEGKMGNLVGRIPDVSILSIHAAADSAAVIATDGSGVIVYDLRKNGISEHYLSDDNDPRSPVSNSVTDVCLDNYGRIWAATTSGVCYQDPLPYVTDMVRHIPGNNNSLLSNSVNSILEDADGDVWFGSDHGVSLFRRSSRKWDHFLVGKSVPSNVLSLSEGPDRQIYAAGFGMRVCAIDKRSGTARQLPARVGNRVGVASDYIFTTFVSGNQIWFGGIEGPLTSLDVTTGRYSYYDIYDVKDIEPLSGERFAIASDRGLYLLHRNQGVVERLDSLGGVAFDKPVTSVLFSRNGWLWIATNGKGLVGYDVGTGASLTLDEVNGLEFPGVTGIVEGGDGKIWFSADEVLLFWDPVDGLVKNPYDFMDIPSGFYNTNAMTFLSNGALACGTDAGVKMIDVNVETDSRLNDAHLYFSSYEEIDEDSFRVGFSSLNLLNPRRVRYEYVLEERDDDWTKLGEVSVLDFPDLPPGHYRLRIRAMDKYSSAVLGHLEKELRVRPPLWRKWWMEMLYVLLILASVAYLLRLRKRRKEESRFRDRIRLFGALAHDIKTPISLIKAPLGEIESLPDLPPQIRSKVRLAVNNADRITDMISQLLDLQKSDEQMGDVQLTECELKPYIEGRVEDFRLSADKKNLELVTEFTDKAPERVMLDRTKMDHILDNLLSNALKYTDEGSIRVRVTGNSRRWALRVRDTGIGIPEKEKENIFREFYRARNAANRKERGMGIGLMVTRRFVEQMGGSISFDSREGVGSTFMAIFPIFRPQAPAGELAASRSGQGKDLVLIVEDDKELRNYLMESLADEYTVVGVPDGIEALSRLDQVNPDIIVSDVMMPGLRGDELCKKLKSSVETSHIPVVLLSAMDDRVNMVAGLESGANEFISKPFDLEVLRLRLRNILGLRNDLRRRILAGPGAASSEDYSNELDKKFMERLLSCIQSRIDDSELSIDDICLEIGMGRTSFYNKLKTLTGESPNSFLRIVRLNKGHELIARKEYTVAEVATMVGFSDPKYFSTCFKKQFGISPGSISKPPLGFRQ